MATVLSSSNFTEALCYFDDILIWGDTWEVHVDRLKSASVLEKVSWAGLALNPTKCQFGVKEVTYLGSIIRNGMVSVGGQRVAHLRSKIFALCILVFPEMVGWYTTPWSYRRRVVTKKIFRMKLDCSAGR